MMDVEDGGMDGWMDVVIGESAFQDTPSYIYIYVYPAG
jgi:hypothetical protein